MTAHTTKTWVEDGKLITVTIPEAHIYKREWVGLTDDEFQWCGNENWPMIRVAEMLKEKNT